MNSLFRRGAFAVLCPLFTLPAWGQFKEIKAAPFSVATAHTKIRALLENVSAENRDQTVATLSGWLNWYRDVLDAELIARWKSEARANVPLLMVPLADARLAREVVEFSWREEREGTFIPAYAPMLGDLMARYPDSARPFLDDLLQAPPPSLTTPQAATVCRIFFDMPDIGSWHQSAMRILPRYRAVADTLLKQDQTSPDQERMYRALRWRAELGLDPPPAETSSRKFSVRPLPKSAANSAPKSQPNPPPAAAQDGSRPHIVGQQPQSAYRGATSGTFESRGEPIPQNGEYVFPDIPPVKLVLDFDTKRWQARLQPGEGQTQVLVMKNISKGAQKKCVVKWSVEPEYRIP